MLCVSRLLCLAFSLTRSVVWFLQAVTVLTLCMKEVKMLCTLLLQFPEL